MADPVGGASGSRAPSAGAAAGPLLEVRGIDKWYGGVKALAGVSFALYAGEILGVVGPNGAGKTTLVDIITGVQAPDSGDVALSGRPLRKGAAYRARSGVSRTFQHPPLSDHLSVLENIELGLLRASAPRSWAGMLAWFLRSIALGHRGRYAVRGGAALAGADREVMDLFAGPLLDEQTANVSYGVEKLTDVARALVSRPGILLMDEPFAGLDAGHVRTVCGILRRWRETRVGVIVVDHNVDILRDLCTRMIVLDHGELIADGSPAAVLERDEVRLVYFGGASGGDDPA